MNKYTLLALAFIMPFILTDMIASHESPQSFTNDNILLTQPRDNISFDSSDQVPLLDSSNQNTQYHNQTSSHQLPITQSNQHIVTMNHTQERHEGNSQSQATKTQVKVPKLILAPTQTLNTKHKIFSTHDSNSESSFLKIPILNKRISQSIWSCEDNFHLSKKSTQNSKVSAYLPKEGNYTLSFNLTIASPVNIERNTQVFITIEINNSTFTFSRAQGFYSQAFTFSGTRGNIEISFKIAVQGKCQGFIYALQSNLSLHQYK